MKNSLLPSSPVSPQVCSTQQSHNKILTKKSLLLRAVLSLVFTITMVSVYAQKPANQTKVRLLKTEADFQNSSILNKLVYGGRPTLYINTTRTKMADAETPQVIDMDASAIANISNNDARYKTAKLLIINIQTEADKHIKLKESQLKSFRDLEYILFSSQIDVSDKEIQEMFSGKANSKITTHYRVLPIAR